MKTLLLCLFLLVSVLSAEPVIRLKKRQLHATADVDAYRASPLKRRHSGNSHFLIEFATPPSHEQIQELRSRGFRVISVVPDSALVVAGPDQASWKGLNIPYIGRLDELDKLSPELSRPDSSNYVIVEFHPDTNPEDMRALVLEGNLNINDRNALPPNQLLVDGDIDKIKRLVEWDEVAYVFPASEALIHNEWAVPCFGALTEEGPIAQYVKEGPGWSHIGPEGSPLELNYVLGQLTSKLPPETAKADIERALNEWAKSGNIEFLPAENASAPRTISIFFAAGDHGDPYPFDGPGRVLAHTFYPPPNSEPLAGDMHLDADESWSSGASVDVFSVVLHEAGHALGLAHSDNPAAVMYPFYKLATALNADDIAGIVNLYGPAQAAPPTPPQDPPTPPAPTPPPPPPPPAPAINITISAPPSATTAQAITISGTASGTGLLRVTWINDRGGSGVASGSTRWVTTVGLSLGLNHLTVTVTDESNRTATQTSQITLSAPQLSDRIAPTLSITAPGTAMVYTSAPSIAFSGTAADNVGVVAVRWTNTFGAGADASGTQSWRIPSIPLLVGTNKITVRASDAAGNSVSRLIMVVRR